MTAIVVLRLFGNAAKQKLRRINKKAAELRGKRNAHLVSTARLLAIFFIVVAGFDIISTNAALGSGQVEGNPFVREVQNQLGAWWSVPKVLFHLMLALLILWHPSQKMISMARLVVVVYLAIFINNSYFAGWLA